MYFQASEFFGALFLDPMLACWALHMFRNVTFQTVCVVVHPNLPGADLFRKSCVLHLLPGLAEFNLGAVMFNWLFRTAERPRGSKPGVASMADKMHRHCLADWAYVAAVSHLPIQLVLCIQEAAAVQTDGAGGGARGMPHFLCLR
jgi:hypothetical protein